MMKTIVVFCVLVAAVTAGPAKNFNSKARIEGRITGGTVAAPHQFPYQVGLYMETQGPHEPFSSHTLCGGSLISNRVVLTAAHCVSGLLQGKVLLGAHAIKKAEPGTVTQEITYKNVILHPEYHLNSVLNDIALIVLPKEVVLNEYIKTVNLPRPDQVQSALEGKVAVITGWGLDGDEFAVSPSWYDLLYANVRILPDEACRQVYPHSFHQTQICVSGDNHKSICSGDSGGPLVVSETDGSKTVVGVVSLGKRSGCELGYPTVFTRVTSYLDWIAKAAGVVPK